LGIFSAGLQMLQCIADGKSVLRGRGRPNLTWEESVKRDLKDWSIIKELAMDRAAWKLAIHVPEP
jgi:hypothetical protein